MAESVGRITPTNFICYLIIWFVFFVPNVSVANGEENIKPIESVQAKESSQTALVVKQAKDGNLIESTASVWLYLLLPSLVLILVGTVAWLWVRSRGGPLYGSGPLKLVQVMGLGQRNRLLVVRYEDVDILIAETPNAISLLHVKPISTDVNSGDANG